MSVGNTRATVGASGERRAIARRAATHPLRDLTEHELDALVQLSRSSILREHLASALGVLGELAERELNDREFERVRAIQRGGR